jgi:iron complex transport system substrate-binding protein
VLPLAALVAAVAVTSVIVARVTPATLLTAPARPETRFGGNAIVRTSGPMYPRAAIGADDAGVEIVRPPMRIVSQYWSADEFLYAIVPPERVVGVSETAFVESQSNVLAEVARYQPVLANDPERVLRARPDLVIAPDSARSEGPALLRHAGVPVYRLFTMFETLAEIEEHITLVGYLTGEDAAAARERERFRAAIDRAVRRRPAGAPAPRVLAFGGTYSYGARTLLADILRVLGAENLAETHGFVGYDRVTDEHVVRWNPDWIVTGAPRGRVEETRATLLARPAVAATSAARRGQVIVIENGVFLPLSPFTSALVDALSVAFYGEGPA